MINPWYPLTLYAWCLIPVQLRYLFTDDKAAAYICLQQVMLQIGIGGLSQYIRTDGTGNWFRSFRMKPGNFKLGYKSFMVNYNWHQTPRHWILCFDLISSEHTCLWVARNVGVSVLIACNIPLRCHANILVLHLTADIWTQTQGKMI